MHKNDPGELVIGGLYEHYSGKRYRVVSVGHHTETMEKVVVYQGLYDDPEFGPRPTWIRPYEMFIETVEKDGASRPRFAHIADEAA